MAVALAIAIPAGIIGAIRRMVDPSPEGLGMSARGITMSSVGLVTGIDRLTQEGIPVTLALSLHAPIWMAPQVYEISPGSSITASP